MQNIEEELRQRKENAFKEEERKRAEMKLVEELEDRERRKEQGIPLPVPPIDSATIPSAPPLQSTLIGDFPVPPTLESVDESSIKDNSSNYRDHGTPSTDTSNIHTPSLYSVNTG